MQILETRHDGTVLCVLTPQEVASLDGTSLPHRKWAVRGEYYLSQGSEAGRYFFEYIIHAPTREVAEEAGRRRVLESRATATICDVGAKDVTGMVKGLFGWG